jgi:hypothetical protein
MGRALHLPERERRLLEDALAALQRATGLKAAVVASEPAIPRGARPDAAIEIQGNGRRLRFLVGIKAVDRAIALATVKHQLRPFGRRGVLVAPYVTAELANHCRVKLDLPFLDTAGNAYLRAPGLYVFIRGERPPGPAATAARGGGTATALRVVFALLCRPELLNAPYREIVTAAGVALGAIGRVFFDLRGRGYVTAGKRTRHRRLLEPGRLLEEWVTNYPIRLRPKLNPRRFRAPDPDWWQKAVLAEGTLWGGEVAAYRLTGRLKPAACTIYFDPATRREGFARLAKDHRLRADPEGEIEILDRFWSLPADPRQPQLAPPVLVYADLVATLDPRNLEIARRIREEHIEHALRPA